jgi:hypothetical protein
MYDANDIVELKKRKKRRRRLIRFLIFLMIAAIAAGLYYYRNAWLPKLQGIGKKVAIIENNGLLAEGNFPIEINDGSSYQLQYSDDTVFMLCDAYVYYYNTSGGLIKKRQHVYSNPVLKVAGGNALIYESGGNEISVENEDRVMYTKSFENTIMFARLSSDGYTAVVTSSGNYACELKIYDDSGTLIYERNCVERISDLSFTDGSKGCVLSYIGAQNGSLTTNVQKIKFDSTEDVWTSPDVDALGIEVYGSDDGAFLIGYTACSYIDSSGQISSYYEYDGDFAGGDSRGGKSAIIINDDDRRKYTMALFSGEGESPLILSFDEPLKYVTISDGLAYVMTSTGICAYDFTGALRSTAEISDAYDEFRRSDDYIFLMGYNRIDRIDYSS